MPAARRASDGGGLGERALGVDVQEGVHVAVDRGDPVEVGLGQLDAGGLAGGRARRRSSAAAALDRVCASLLVPQDPGHGEALLLDAGAPESACSAVRPGTTTSSRNTLVSGSGCEVGGMSSPATPLIEATDSRITDQLRREVVELGVGQVDPGEVGQVGDLVTGDRAGCFRHGASLVDDWVRGNPSGGRPPPGPGAPCPSPVADEGAARRLPA